MALIDHPMPAADSDFYFVGGTLHPDAPCYVEREADRILYQALGRGEFCYVLTSRQMGKSSLMNRTAVRLRADGVTVAILDLTALGENQSAEQWYWGLLDLLGRRLGMEDELDDFWQEHEALGPLRRWMAAVQEVVLPRLGARCSVLGARLDPAGGTSAVPGLCPTGAEHRAPSTERLVIFIDEIDCVRSLPFSTDEFFAAIRECYNRRSEDPNYNRLTFCLLGVATPSDLIRDTRMTPFNIGRRIDLNDFTEAEAAPLRVGLALGSPETLGRSEAEARALMQRILYWTGGHPYLTQRLCQAVADADSANPKSRIQNPESIDRLCDELFLSARARERDDNLLFVRERLLKSEVDLAGLLELYARVRAGKRVLPDDTNALLDVLRLAGITRIAGVRRQASGVSRDGGSRRMGWRLSWPLADALRLTPDACLQVRNRIYERVFDREWIAQHMPDAEVRRQRAAYRRGLVRATVVAGAVVAVMGALAVSAFRSERRAQREKRVAILAQSREQVQRVAAQAAEQKAAQSAAAERQAAHLAQEKSVEAMRAASQERAAAERERKQKQTAMAAEERALTQKQRADQQRRVADQRRLEARRILYVSQMKVAQQSWEEGSVGRAQDLLEAWRPKLGEEDLRGFEWRYLWRLTHTGARFTWQPSGGAGYGVAFSPDGRKLATKGGPMVRLWDLGTKQELFTLETPTTQLDSPAFSPDGKLLATGGRDGTVKLWDLASRHTVATWKAHEKGVSAIAFSPNGKTLATASGNELKFWLDAGVAKRTATTVDTAPIDLMAFSPDGRILATCGTDNERGNDVHMLDVMHPEQVTALQGHTAGVRGLAFSPDGKTLASASFDTTVKLWEVASRRRLTTLAGHQGPVASVAFSPDGKTLASGSYDATVKLWDVSTERELTTLRGHQRMIWTVAFSPDGKNLVSSSQDGTVKLWDPAVDREDVVLRDPQGVGGVVYSPEGRLLAVNRLNPDRVELWNLAARRRVAQPSGTQWGIYSVAFSPDGRLLAHERVEKSRFGVGGSVVEVWSSAQSPGNARKGLLRPPAQREDEEAWKRLATVKAWHGGDAMQSIAFSPDSKTLAFVGPDKKSVRLWDVVTQRTVAVLPGHNLGVWGIAFSPDGRTLASGSQGEPVWLWDVPSRKPIARLVGSDWGISPLVFSPDAKTLITAGPDRTIRHWDLATRQLIGTFKGHASPNGAHALSPDGKTLATADLSTITLWSLAGHQAAATLRGHTADVWAMAFSPDGNTLASAGMDGTLRLWRAAPFPETDRLQVVSSSGDGRVRLEWQPVPSALGYHVYRSLAGRDPASFQKLTTRPLTETSFTDRSPKPANAPLSTYAVAAIFRSSDPRIGRHPHLVEGPRAIVHVRPASVPAPWTGSSISEGNRPGSVSLDTAADTISLRGAGADIGGSADGCYFLNQPITGDFQITVRLLSLPPKETLLARTGLMVRETLHPGARHTSLLASLARGLLSQWRTAPDDVTNRDAVIRNPPAAPALKPPMLLRLRRKGNAIFAEYSVDGGRHYLSRRDPVVFDPPLGATLYAGVAITSHDPNKMSEARFSGLKIERPGKPR